MGSLHTPSLESFMALTMASLVEFGVQLLLFQLESVCIDIKNRRVKINETNDS